MSGRPDDGRRLERALCKAQAGLHDRLDVITRVTPRDVHETRVAVRRLRSLLKTFEPLLAEPVARTYRTDLKRLADALAELREIDVMTNLEPLAAEPLAAAVARERRAAVRRLRQDLVQPEMAAAIGRLRRPPAMARLGLRHQTPTVELLRRVRKAWRRVDQRAKRSTATLEARHELRIVLKHCRYCLEIVDDVEPELAADLLRRLRAAQQQLGDERDLAVARSWLRQGSAGAISPAVRAAAERRLQRRQRDAQRKLPRVMERVRREGARWDGAVSKVMRRARRDPARP